jgi:hypothetical protein
MLSRTASFLAMWLLVGCAKSEGNHQATTLTPTHPFPEGDLPSVSSPPPLPPRAPSEAVIGSGKKYKEDPNYKPTSCADVGEHVGYASCCQGTYCAGFCDPKEGCVCDLTQGCLWPEVCGLSCLAPEAAVVHVKQGDHMMGVSALTGKPEDVGKYIKEVKVINEGNTCGLPEPKTIEELIQNHGTWLQQTCCQGKICPGLCVTRPSHPEPHCECAGLQGGCVSPHVCCGIGYQSCVDADKCPTKTKTWPH